MHLEVSSEGEYDPVCSFSVTPGNGVRSKTQSTSENNITNTRTGILMILTVAP